MTVILDIDLDAFVSPVAANRPIGAPRLSDAEYAVESWDDVRRFLINRCHLPGMARGAAVEEHDEVLAVLEGEILAQRLTPPFRWIHVDPHDDVGNACQDEETNSGNFLCECVQRMWIAELILVQKTVAFPQMLAEEHGETFVWRGTTIPVSFLAPEDFSLDTCPDFVLLARSPSFTPRRADILYERMRKFLNLTAA